MVRLNRLYITSYKKELNKGSFRFYYPNFYDPEIFDTYLTHYKNGRYIDTDVSIWWYIKFIATSYQHRKL